MRIDWRFHVLAALAGALYGLRIDYKTFQAFKDWNDFAKYDWSVALFRAFQGAVIGVVGSAALDQGLSAHLHVLPVVQ